MLQEVEISVRASEIGLACVSPIKIPKEESAPLRSYRKICLGLGCGKCQKLPPGISGKLGI